MNYDNYRLLAAEWGCTWMGKSLPENEHAVTQWKCNKEEHQWETSFSRFNGCRQCVTNAPKAEEDYHFLAKLKGIKWTDWVLPKNTKMTTRWECLEGHSFDASYYNVRRRSKCPHCKVKR